MKEKFLERQRKSMRNYFDPEIEKCSEHEFINELQFSICQAQIKEDKEFIDIIKTCKGDISIEKCNDCINVNKVEDS